ncbi:predicted protein [Nematostella vectensis]|uniref:Kazal-like domain-containing protein n=1 Tax=Nematostella vectensis TaxID=45351 RepID=A7SGJ4_NEMVE|nr:uncharacterized protein LOC5508646 [Nematostella vectensis]XP_032233324.1 uncharacterized protein LOC5508646 [Nematostella vectensis]XP_048590424.1 uncharacterized protein LOC5508646 [Nematostella vectensis]EDO37147.1 predicted protein [Nematostella vectensis]|eukprot:XP_001629210.1 predicted protein [Nematostella vectensis]
MAVMRDLCFIFTLIVLASAAFAWRHETKWGEKAPPGCVPCPKNKEDLFDTPICGQNGIAYKNYCYLRLRNCIAKKLKKKEVLPSKEPSTCGLQMKMYNSFGGGLGGPFGKKRKRAISKLIDTYLR